MSFFFILSEYIVWHYSRAILDLVKIYGNLLWFIFNFFSIPLLFKTWFAPWRRLNENYPSFFDGWEFFSTLIINILMRLVGFFVRTVLLIIGLGVYLFLIVSFPVVMALWLLWPVVIIGILFWGLSYIF